MSKSFIFLLFLLAASINSLAQKPSDGFKANYRAASQLMQQGKYGLAMQSFKNVLKTSESNELTPYAQYYLAYSAYKAKDKELAWDAFLQITVKHDTWDQLDAVYLWLSILGFEQSGPFKGMLYANKISAEPYISKANKHIKGAIDGLSVDVLSSLNQEYPQNPFVANEYATALSKLPYTAESDSILNQLVKDFGLNLEMLNRIPESEKKDFYDIGIVLPFFIDRMEGTGNYLIKSLAIDIYEGAKLAAYEVDSSLFRLHAFDSKKDADYLAGLMESGGLDKMDVILGPLYPQPVEIMKSFASTNKINFVNPTSSNQTIAESSKYAFLSRASAEELAQKAARNMQKQQINKNLFIYYGTSDVDSISAFVYKEVMESDSFNVIEISKIDTENRRQVYDGLTASVTISDRHKISRMTREQIRGSLQLPTMDSLLIQPDSIGHIFIASSDPTVPTEAMSAIISRGDSIHIMGVGNWFESENAGLGIMEGLGVTLAISEFDDISTLEHKRLSEQYIDKYHKQPGKYFFRGYYGMKFIAKSLKHYGTYFQNGYMQKGNFDETMDFSSSNSNSAVKIIKMVNNKITDAENTVADGDAVNSSSKY